MVRANPVEPHSISASMNLVVQILRFFTASLVVVVAEGAGKCVFVSGGLIHGALELSLDSLVRNTWQPSSSP